MLNMIEDLDELYVLIAVNKCAIAVDMGGSLIKILVHVKNTGTTLIESECQMAIFDARDIEDVILILSRASKESSIAFLGGGSYKMTGYISSIFEPGQIIIFVDEMQSISEGAMHLKPPGIEKSLVLNVGSGVSVLKIDSTLKTSRRISGSCIGGGTFMGLVKACVSDALSFQDAVSLAINGNSENCDLLVKDIYGDSYPGLAELPGNIVASSMGKFQAEKDPESIAASLLNMVVIHIAQLAYFVAQLHPDHQLLFSGSFFSDSDRHVEGLLEGKLRYWDLEGHVLPFNAFVGCFGALYLIKENLYDTA